MSTARTDRLLVALRVVPEKWDHRNGARARHCGRVGLSGAALFTVFEKGCWFFLPCGTRRARRKGRSESASGKGKIEDQKTRTLEHHKGAPPEVQNQLQAGPTANEDRKEKI
jgi:hypothetical protein